MFILYATCVIAYRQALANLAQAYYGEFIKSFAPRANPEEARDHFLDLMLDLDSLLAQHPQFSFEHWMKDAALLSKTSEETKVYAFNARNLLTRWGPNGQITDYSSRLWSGLIRTYYHPRWKLAMDAAIIAWRHDGQMPRDGVFTTKLEEFEQRWQTKGVRVEPRRAGKPVFSSFKAHVAYMYHKYHRKSARSCRNLT